MRAPGGAPIWLSVWTIASRPASCSMYQSQFASVYDTGGSTAPMTSVPHLHGDDRGVFVETYRREWLPQGREMVQANRADRQAGCVVGLHYHLHQADYWYVPAGRARVVLHDLRVGSPTDGATVTLDLG